MGIERALQVCRRLKSALMPLTDVLQEDFHHHSTMNLCLLYFCPGMPPSPDNVRPGCGEARLWM